MKMTIEQLEKKYNQAKKAEADTLAYIREQTENIVKLKEMEAEAAEAGNLEKYQELKRQRGNLEDLVFVKQASLKNLFNPQDVYDSWNAYAAGYNKELARRKKEFEKACIEMKNAFMNMLQLQNNAFEPRELCGIFLGLEFSDDDHRKLEEQLQMDYIDAPDLPELLYRYQDSEGSIMYSAATKKAVPAFLGAMNLATPAELKRMWLILQLHKHA